MSICAKCSDLCLCKTIQPNDADDKHGCFLDALCRDDDLNANYAYTNHITYYENKLVNDFRELAGNTVTCKEIDATGINFPEGPSLRKVSGHTISDRVSQTPRWKRIASQTRWPS